MHAFCLVNGRGRLLPEAGSAGNTQNVI